MKDSDTRANIKAKLLSVPVKHVDITTFDARPIIEAMAGMSFTSRELARAADIYDAMLADPACTIILTLAGSTSAAGCMQVYADFIRHGMVDVVVATGASIVDMDFFEAIGFRHFQGSADVDDGQLRSLSIDRIYDTYIDEEELKACDRVICDIADELAPRPYSSREFIREMGAYLAAGNAKKANSLVQCAYENDVPVFCPAFTDSGAGFGLALHQRKSPDQHVSIDSVKDFGELTDIKIVAESTGLLMIGGGVPKNFAQDIVVCAELLGHKAEMHRYAVQITVADVRDGASSSSTLKEANSWGKVDTVQAQMVYAEAGSVVPLLASDAYHRGAWRNRERRRLARMFD